MPASTLNDALANVVGVTYCVAERQLPQYAVDRVAPRAVVFPGSEEETAGVMKVAAEQRLAVTVRGGGTAMALGNPIERLDVVIGTSRMDRIVAHEPEDLTVTVEAGVTLQRLNDHLANYGQGVSLDAPIPERATIGGALAANTTGPRRLGFGAPRDRLIGIRVVDAEGTVFKAGGKVVKNVAGYDLNKLLVGSLGTLGIIVEAAFKLAPLPRERAAVLGAFVELENAMQAADAIRGGFTRPLALDLLNRAAFDVVAAKAGVPGWHDRQYILAVDIGGGDAAIARQKQDLHKAIVSAGGNSTIVEGHPHYPAFWRWLMDMGRREELPAAMHTRCSVRYGDVAPLVHGHEALADGAKQEVGIDVHLTSGTLRAAWWGEGKGPADSAILAESVSTLRTAAGHVGGTFVVESAPLSVKRLVDVWGPAGPELAVMKRIKEQFDPARLLSPGRFVGGI